MNEMISNRTISEDDPYKDAPGLDPELEWEEEEYWVNIMMKERFEKTFESVLLNNKNGEVRNLLITDNEPDFLNNALSVLREWSLKNSINLVEVDEKDSSWLPEIQTRELFYKLNQPSTVLLVKNYATVHYMRGDDNTPRNFLRDAIMNRHYGCGNDFVPSDDLPNLLFVVVLNDLSEMSWREDEYSLFTIMHEYDETGLWMNTSYRLHTSDMHPVMSVVNRVKYFASDDGAALCFDAGDAFPRIRQEGYRPIRLLTAEERTDIILTYLENNLPDFNEKIECLILKIERFPVTEHFVIDADRLRKSLPNIKSIYCTEAFEIVNQGEHLDVYNPFEVGEHIFSIAQTGDFETANYLTRRLWAFDHKQAKFFRMVARDYCRKPEDHVNPESDSGLHNWTGMDHLFHIYMLGWWHSGDDFFDAGDKVLAKKYKNADKAIALLPIRFQNCEVAEVTEKLYWDIKHIENDDTPDYELFAKVLVESERLFPGVIKTLPLEVMNADLTKHLSCLLEKNSK